MRGRLVDVGKEQKITHKVWEKKRKNSDKSIIPRSDKGAYILVQGAKLNHRLDRKSLKFRWITQENQWLQSYKIHLK